MRDDPISHLRRSSCQGVHVEQGHVIGHAEGVEFRLLQGLHKPPQMGEVEVRVCFDVF